MCFHKEEIFNRRGRGENEKSNKKYFSLSVGKNLDTLLKYMKISAQSVLVQNLNQNLVFFKQTYFLLYLHIGISSFRYPLGYKVKFNIFHKY